MADSTLYQGRDYSPGLVSLRLKITIGSSGAVSAYEGYGGVPVLNTTGIYDITLDRGHGKLYCFTGSVIRASGSALQPILRADYTVGSTTLEFYTVVDAGTATQPSSGDIIVIEAVFRDAGF
jgi:hypothetical protein